MKQPIRRWVWLATAAIVLSGVGEAQAGTGGVGASQDSSVPGGRARLSHGLAIPPEKAPARVVRAIEAANRIVQNRPYCYGGGHGRWNSSCYDCSGSVSYALGKPGARVIDAPMASNGLARLGKSGRGRWISVYANGGHAYAVIAGLRLDTSMTAGDGPGWSARQRSARGFRVRHPVGL